MFLLLLSLVVVGVARPKQHRVANVPYWRQNTEFGCGDAAVQMALGRWGVEAAQERIANVMRTTTSEGTLSLDVARAAWFSPLSFPMGNVFPSLPASSGWGRALGLLSGWRDDAACWTAPLLDLVALDVPVVVLQHFDPLHVEPDDGHFRLVVGYDEHHVVMLDPWDRDGWPRVLRWPFAQFCAAWNYTERQSPRSLPFFGAALWPLELRAAFDASGPSLRVTLGYPSLLPNAPPLSQPRVQLQLVSLGSNSSFAVPPVVVSSAGTAACAQPTLESGHECSVVFQLARTGAWTRPTALRALLRGSGLVAVSMPPSWWNATVRYSGYDVLDVVGSDDNSTTIMV